MVNGAFHSLCRSVYQILTVI
jgi:hypothetical protein